MTTIRHVAPAIPYGQYYPFMTMNARRFIAGQFPMNMTDQDIEDWHQYLDDQEQREAASGRIMSSIDSVLSKY